MASAKAIRIVKELDGECGFANSSSLVYNISEKEEKQRVCLPFVLSKFIPICDQPVFSIS